MQNYKERKGETTHGKGGEMVADARRTAGTEAAEDVDSSRISPKWVCACLRLLTEDAGGSRRH